MRFRPTVRTRLTAWYASMFLAVGVILLASAYWIVRHNIAVYPQQVNRALLPPPTRIKGRPTEAQARELLAHLRSARSRAEQTVQVRTRHRVALEFLGVLLLATAGAIATGYVVAGRVMRPVTRITATARHVGQTNLHQRIALDGPRDELKELADTFDSMLDRLEHAFATQREFVANASHELMTPLAIIRAELDATLGDPNVDAADLRRMARVVDDAVARSERLLTSLLMLARSERGLEQRSDVDVAAVVERVVSSRADRFREARLRVEQALAPAHVVGDDFLLETLVANLLDNAIRYNEARGVVIVETSRDGGGTLRVANSGPHVPRETVERLWRPFVRADPSRSRATGGTGLGLAIVRAIAVAHGAEATAVAGEEGGLDVRVTFPAPV